MPEAQTILPKSAARGTLGWLAATVVAVGVCIPFFHKGKPNPQSSNAAVFIDAAGPVREPQREIPIKPVAGPVAPTPPEALGNIGRVDRLLRDYLARLNEYPVGSNAEITAMLMGRNAKSIKFLVPGEAPLNDKNELVDHWQTPYFFHQVSGTRMEVRSAGPDREMWTADDVKLNPR